MDVSMQERSGYHIYKTSDEVFRPKRKASQRPRTDSEIRNEEVATQEEKDRGRSECMRGDLSIMDTFGTT